MVPSPPGLAAARRFAGGRRGDVAFAVVGTDGRLSGLDPRRRFPTASAVKALLLVAYLDARGGRELTGGERQLLDPMIRRSGNRAASAVFRSLGADAVRRAAARAGMRDFLIGGNWSGALASPADLARLFARFDRLVPERHVAYARQLLETVIRRQSWGVPQAARPAWRVFHKAGWRPSAGGRLVTQAALVQRDERRLAIAVMGDGFPWHGYGTLTVRGIARRLLRGADVAGAGGDPARTRLRRAGLVDLEQAARGIRLDIRYATARNITRRRLPGYCRPWAYLARAPALALGQVQRDLRRRGLGLLVFDGYRPARATRALVRWDARHNGGRGVREGYIARRSNHNRGAAVDLTLVDRETGRRLDLGSFDTLGGSSHTRNARGRRLRNRLTLVRAMERRGFRNYPREWWHFDHPRGLGRALDVPLGCPR